jgi:hypothetical protein
MHPQDIKDEAFYQCHDYQHSLQLCEAWWKTRIGLERNQFPNPRTLVVRVTLYLSSKPNALVVV